MNCTCHIKAIRMPNIWLSYLFPAFAAGIPSPQLSGVVACMKRQTGRIHTPSIPRTGPSYQSTDTVQRES